MSDKDVREVIDKTTDRWIKIVGILAAITLPLFSGIGAIIIYELKEIRKEVNHANVRFENHEGRISRNSSDIKIINGKLEGKYDGR